MAKCYEREKGVLSILSELSFGKDNEQKNCNDCKFQEWIS